MNEKRKNNMYFGMYSIALIILIIGLYSYIHRSIGHMPLMDYWLNGAERLRHILYDPIDLKMFISFPHAIHWNPFYELYDYIFVRVFRADNCSYIYAGMIIVGITTILVMKFYNRYFKCGKLGFDFVGIIVVILPLYNLNQWEIITLSCYVAFALRVFVYLLLWIWADNIIKNKVGNIQLISFVIISFMSIMYVSQAYYPGFVCAICGNVIFRIVLEKNINKTYIVLLTSQILSAIICYLTTVHVQIGANGSYITGNVILDYLEGILLMLAATVIPVTMQGSIGTCFVVGMIIFVLAIVSVVLFFKNKIYKETYLPLMLLIYAFSSIIIIVLGRMYTYGFQSLGSSRYVVETTLGLMGMIEIYWYSICHSRMIQKIECSFIVLVIVAGIIFANKTEWGIGPARAMYNLRMQEVAENIDSYSDDELAIFQSNSQDVRETIQFMKENHLCIWR